MPLEQVTVIPAFSVKVNGDEVVVDHRTFTLAERRLVRRGLMELAAEDDLAPDWTDQLAASLWVVLRRSDPDLTIAEVFDSFETSTLADGEPIAGEPTEEADDPEV